MTEQQPEIAAAAEHAADDWITARYDPAYWVKRIEACDGDRHVLPTLNRPLIARVLDWARKSEGLREIIAQPADDFDGPRQPVALEGSVGTDGRPLEMRWDQGVWTCGTACCIAGAAALASGARMSNNNDGVIFEGDFHSASWVAQRCLGITTAEARILFHGAHSLRTIEAIIEAFEIRRGLTPQK
jgi:hypothetical protein